MSSASLIDVYGLLSAEIADLEKVRKEVKDKLVEQYGFGAFEGNLFRVSISLSSRQTLDMDAVREKLSPQFIRVHTKEAEFVVVKAAARSAQNLAA